ncbi:hypothetical protein [Caulobacter sp. NIBR2454]|uniref:hypothetical protein n=1 Tax=Caulobacter sp. NIBR2454 TaxID=3015996 RepID=UPI0022B65541|nr:hypothetical protein [Caulobacter sp. NIBR2454]
MVAQVINLFRRPAALPEDWSQAEIAEFYRVESALIQAGLRIETDRGISDEGEPWFVFCRADDGEVVIHFARIDGHYIVSSPAYDGVAEGLNFQALVRNLLDRHPLVQTRKAANNNVFLHPAALLIAIVGTAFFKTGEAKADDGSQKTDARRALLTSTSQPTQVVLSPGEGTIKIDGAQAMAILTSAMLILQRDGALAATGQTRAALASFAPALEREAAPAAPLTGLAPEASRLDLNFNPADPTLKSLLALTAVLSDLPAATGPAAASASLLQSGAAFASTPAGVQGATPNASVHAPVIERWQLEIDLRAADVPEVSAIRVVQNLAQGELAGVTVHEGRLPDILAKIIAQGDVVNGAITIQPQAPSQGDAPPPSTEAPVAPESPVAETPSPPTPTAPTPAIDQQAVAKQIFDFFVAHTSKVEIVVTGNAVVLYDASLMRTSADWSDVTSLTFNFDDGSSISVVGHAHAVYDYHHGG